LHTLAFAHTCYKLTLAFAHTDICTRGICTRGICTHLLQAHTLAFAHTCYKLTNYVRNKEKHNSRFALTQTHTHSYTLLQHTYTHTSTPAIPELSLMAASWPEPRCNAASHVVGATPAAAAVAGANLRAAMHCRLMTFNASTHMHLGLNCSHSCCLVCKCFKVGPSFMEKAALENEGTSRASILLHLAPSFTKRQPWKMRALQGA